MNVCINPLVSQVVKIDEEEPWNGKNIISQGKKVQLFRSKRIQVELLTRSKPQTNAIERRKLPSKWSGWMESPTTPLVRRKGSERETEGGAIVTRRGRRDGERGSRKVDALSWAKEETRRYMLNSLLRLLTSFLSERTLTSL